MTIPTVAWTGGDRPPKHFKAEPYLAKRKELFRSQLNDWVNYWGGVPAISIVRIFWRRATYDAWRSYTSHETMQKDGYES